MTTFIKMVPAASRKLPPSSGTSNLEPFSRATCNDPNQVPFRFELKTDEYPDQTSWALIDVETNNVLISADEGTYSRKHFLYVNTYCIEISKCYEFTIYDSAGDGICCDGWYKIFYEDTPVLPMKTGDFGETKMSVRFGDDCLAPPSSPAFLLPLVPALSSASPNNNPSLTKISSKVQQSNDGEEPSSIPSSVLPVRTTSFF
jgi:hypothetical protein